jgi:hypothetical protein
MTTKHVARIVEFRNAYKTHERLGISVDGSTILLLDLIRLFTFLVLYTVG